MSRSHQRGHTRPALLVLLFALALVGLAWCGRGKPTCDPHPGPTVQGTALDCGVKQ